MVREMIEDLADNLKKRIVAVAAEEYPGCTVAFEDERKDFIHFHINRPDGESISGGSPPYLWH